MPRYAEPVPAPSAKKAAPPAARRSQPQQKGTQRNAIWHLMQLKAAQNAAPGPAPPSPSRLPASLQAGVETLSGLAMDDVRVHRSSPEPAKLGALAYAQGSDIHLGPGQEQHLPHEAWHVVQQKQGRVRATAQMKGAALNDDRSLEREADAMGTRAASLGASVPAQHIAAPPVALGANASASSPIQCAGHIRFANLSGEAKYVTKAQAIVAGLLATPSIQNFMQNKDALITLESDSQLASVSVVGDQVQITLSPWFFEQESRGRILGMLAHEFGVHPLARAAMSQAELAQEQLDIQQDTAFATGIAQHNITPGAAGQHDHVFAAVSGQPRFRIYRRTVHEMASALFATAHGQNANGVTEAHVTDLIMTYLSDIAMILATNDHRGQIVANPGRTAQAFNLERARWINSLNAQNAADAGLIRLTPGQKTASNVLGEVKSIAGSWLLSIFTGSTSDINMAHQTLGGGVVAPTNRNQANVLADHGLQLIPAQNNATSFFDAVELGGGLNNVRQQVLVHMGQNLNDALVPPVIQYLNANAVINGAISRSHLNIIVWAVAASQHPARCLRVLEPSGKMTGFDYPGAALTIVRVEKPAPHYRAAQ
jgi:hypothetical protein